MGWMDSPLLKDVLLFGNIIIIWMSYEFASKGEGEVPTLRPRRRQRRGEVGRQVLQGQPGAEQGREEIER